MDMVCASLNELTLAAHWLNGHSRAVMAITPRSLAKAAAETPRMWRRSQMSAMLRTRAAPMRAAAIP